MTVRMNFRVGVLLLAFLAMGRGVGTAAEQVWVGLYLAQNSPPREGAQLAPEKLAVRLHSVFGFKHYVLLKSQNIELGNEWEQWFVPSHDFFIRLEPLLRPPGQPRHLDYQIYDAGFLVARGRYEPRKDRPLFINGPDFRDGILLFVLEPRADSIPE